MAQEPMFVPGQGRSLTAGPVAEGGTERMVLEKTCLWVGGGIRRLWSRILRVLTPLPRVGTQGGGRDLSKTEGRFGGPAVRIGRNAHTALGG